MSTERSLPIRSATYSHNCMSYGGRCTITVHYRTPPVLDGMPLTWAEAACGGPVQITGEVDEVTDDD